jgi:choline dehydrogenase-like flavoprotein
LIIGSGAGGSTTANVLAEQGFEVVVLEEGERHTVADYGQSPTKAMNLLYRNRGIMPIMGSVPIGYVEGRTLGGSTEINSGFWHRLPPEFLMRWQARFNLSDFTQDSLAEHFEWAEKILISRPAPWPLAKIDRGFQPWRRSNAVVRARSETSGKRLRKQQHLLSRMPKGGKAGS